MTIGAEDEELDLDETEIDDVPVEENRPSFPVVGVLLTDRKIKFPIFKELKASMWRLGNGVSIMEIGDKRCVFTFCHSVDMKRVLYGGPWQFGRNFLIRKEVKPDDFSHKICLNEAEFWVQGP
ncbi:unnamed protein product [Cuscuta epithymum]|uniref:DUF4283 domain-containing protein n=1 Tax=Cuscuta epithymum TaxID=186058 RepID=A0AAV0C5F7_9ASTE|nr:unnamed protein product [Cuscuta epithymum]